ASARNVIERIFGILKRRFRILLLAPEYDIDIQARIPAALCAVHNFIRTHGESEEGTDDISLDEDDEGEQQPGPRTNPQATEGTRNLEEDILMRGMRDDIATAMWADYQHILVERAQSTVDSESDAESDFFEEEVASLF
ncbi:hypothetical protein M404DRAFT_151496, partial [Pisolithus tinctorius Marx 270]